MGASSISTLDIAANLLISAILEVRLQFQPLISHRFDIFGRPKTLRDSDPQIRPKNGYVPTFETLDFLNIHTCFFDFQIGK